MSGKFSLDVASSDKVAPILSDAAAGRIALIVMKAWNIRGSKPKKNSRKRAKRNPAGGVRVVHNRLLGGWYVVRGPHQTPLNGRFESKEAAQQWLIDQKNMRDAPRNNPKRRARKIPRPRNARRINRAIPKLRQFGMRRLPKTSTAFMPRPRNYAALRSKRPLVRARMKRGGYRVNPARRYPIGNRAGVGAICVYVKAGVTFRPVAAFYSERQAIDYARALHRANPRATIKVSRGASR